MSSSVAEQVGEAQRILDAQHQLPQLGRDAGGQRDGLLDLLVDAADVGVDLDAACRAARAAARSWPAAIVPVRRHGRRRATRATPFDDDVQAVSARGHLPDDADRADRLELRRVRRRRRRSSCSTSSSMRSLASARLTDSTETGRFTASGCSVSGNATVRRSGSTGSDVGSEGGVCGSAMRSEGRRRRSSDHTRPGGFGTKIARMALDERAFFTERPEQRNGRYTCPRCRRVNDYQLRWVRRTKKDRPPANADPTDKRQVRQAARPPHPRRRRTHL